MVVIIWILKGIAALVISWGIAFCFSMFFFWIDLEINLPQNQSEIDFIKSKHLEMNKYLHVWVLLVIWIYIAFK
jgi:hypothetical protein